jgi:hypothetical protein
MKHWWMILAFLHIGGNSDGGFSACVVGEKHTTTAGSGTTFTFVQHSTTHNTNKGKSQRLTTPTRAKNTSPICILQKQTRLISIVMITATCH